MTRISVNILFSTVLMLFSLTGCTTKIHKVHILSDKTIDETATVAVIPFSGDGYYRSVAGEWFTHQLRKKITNALMSPAMVEMSLAEHNVTLGFNYQGRKWSQPKSRLIRSQHSVKHIDEEKKEYQTYIFSKEDIIEIGQILNVDIVINGSVSSVHDIGSRFVKLVEIQVIDVKKQSIIGIFQSGSIKFPYKRSIVTDLENITLDITQLFSARVKAEQ